MSGQKTSINPKFIPDKIKQKLKKIPKKDWPKFLKKNHTDIWYKLAWSKVKEWRNNQKEQAEILGDTPDYSRNLFTLDERSNRMVNFAFEKYFKDGLIYKGAYLINWSVGLQTALSDVAGEIEYEKRIDPFVTFEYQAINYKILDEDLAQNLGSLNLEKYLKKPEVWPRLRMFTVRIETKFTDLAVAMHPSKFENYFNQDIFTNQASTELQTMFLDGVKNGLIDIFYDLPPLKSAPVKLVFSKKVDPNFGTGIVKLTPGHDIFDFNLYQEFVKEGKLPAGAIQTCVDRDGKLKKEFAGEYAGLTVEEARPLIIKKLIEGGFIPKMDSHPSKPLEGVATNTEFLSLSTVAEKYKWLEEKYPQYAVDWKYEHNVTICERSKTVIEPLISEEFFLDYKKPVQSQFGRKTLQEFGLEGVAETNFYSSDFKNRAENFLENINNWCISRDLVWGHKIPVWYNLNVNPEKRFYSFKELERIANSELPMTISAKKPDLPGNWVQEEKIFDTWFSSCLWPLSTLNFLDYTKQKQQVLIIHGGEVFETETEYQEFLKKSEVRFKSAESFKDWKMNFLENLHKHANLEVIYPEMPLKQKASYQDWKIVFEKVVPTHQTLIGHSLGGIFLAKYLAENDLKVKQLHLVSAPFQNLGDFILPKDLSKLEKNVEEIFIWHSTDDEIVDFEEAEKYAEKLPKARLMSFKDRGHFLQSEFFELEREILKSARKDKELTLFEQFYPTDEMTTAKEIFYLWIVRMIILGKYFTGQIPFKSVVITPTILDDKGRKMSKSLGNGLDPKKAIDAFSSDALRMAMLSGMIPNRNMKMGGRIANELMEKYRNFGNKVWNVGRFLWEEGEGKNI